ncbi:GPW/gp25 family protein [Methylobacterium sp. 37f]|uniref:type VI secretion system baseplate subunit TssE n=1 Tax=Methylobacterium sp. 37f TaxID=2817058 RepID=UPI001FFCE08F|nr:GPW/gp25 family protein [Methylobacterium sp. 37f]
MRDRGDARERDDSPSESVEGRAVVSGRRSVTKGAISESDLQAIVRHDLTALMNTVHFAAGEDLSDHSHVASSILNFGFPDLLRRSIDENRINDIGAEIETAFTIFESRCIPGSVRVTPDSRVPIEELRVRFIISAEIRSDPLNLPVRFVADLERDTGKIVVQRR